MPQCQHDAPHLLRNRSVGGARGDSDVSRAKKALLAITLLLGSATYAAAEVRFATSNLNLRAGPGPAFGVIAVLPAGTKMSVQKCGDEWCRVQLGRQVGYVSADLVKTGVDTYASAVPQPAPVEPKATLTGPRIWRWRDSDWRDDHWRQLDWHNRMNRR